MIALALAASAYLRARQGSTDAAERRPRGRQAAARRARGLRALVRNRGEADAGPGLGAARRPGRAPAPGRRSRRPAEPGRRRPGPARAGSRRWRSLCRAGTAPPEEPLTAAELRILSSCPVTSPSPRSRRAVHLSPNTVKTHVRSIYRKFGSVLAPGGDRARPRSGPARRRRRRPRPDGLTGPSPNHPVRAMRRGCAFLGSARPASRQRRKGWMPHLLAITYPDEALATRAAEEVGRCAGDLGIDPDAAAVVVCGHDGSCRLTTSRRPGATAQLERVLERPARDAGGWGTGPRRSTRLPRRPRGAAAPGTSALLIALSRAVRGRALDALEPVRRGGAVVRGLGRGRDGGRAEITRSG